MSKNQRQTPRKPATKFAHLQEDAEAEGAGKEVQKQVNHAAFSVDTHRGLMVAGIGAIRRHFPTGGAAQNAINDSLDVPV